MRVVLDTNIFLSGIHWSGASHKVLRAWFSGRFTLVSSPQINEELFTQLRDFKIEMKNEEILWWEDVIINKAIMVMPQKRVHIVKKDPDDDKFIEAALEGKAEYIVTQDEHLLEIGKYNKIKILTPKEFLESLK